MPEHLTITVRPMAEGDLDAVQAIDKAMVGPQRAATYANPVVAYGGEIEDSVVAEVRGQVVGFVLGRLAESQYGKRDAAWVELVGVHQDFQGQGVGRALMKGFISECRRRGVRSIHIMVNWGDDRMKSFVSALGFNRGELVEYGLDLEAYQE